MLDASGVWPKFKVGVVASVVGMLGAGFDAAGPAQLGTPPCAGSVAGDCGTGTGSAGVAGVDCSQLAAEGGGV